MPIIIDGYNFIGRSRRLRIEDPDCREKLIQSLIEYCRLRKKEVIVVFDGAYLGHRVNRKRTYGRMTVIYSSGGSNADEEIEKLVRRNQQKKQLHIVTSDNEVRDYARSLGAKVTRSEEFERDMEKTFARNRDPKKRARPLSKKELEAWIKIFTQPRPEEEALDFSFKKKIEPSPGEKPSGPLPGQKHKGVPQEEPFPDGERRKKVRRGPEKRRDVDRVHVYLSETEVQEWLEIFRGNRQT